MYFRNDTSIHSSVHTYESTLLYFRGSDSSSFNLGKCVKPNPEDLILAVVEMSQTI
jgi:hypothetical protein